MIRFCVYLLTLVALALSVAPLSATARGSAELINSTGHRIRIVVHDPYGPPTHIVIDGYEHKSLPKYAGSITGDFDDPGKNAPKCQRPASIKVSRDAIMVWFRFRAVRGSESGDCFFTQ